VSNLRVAKALTMQVGHLRSYQSAGLTTLKQRHLLLQAANVRLLWLMGTAYLYSHETILSHSSVGTRRSLYLHGGWRPRYAVFSFDQSFA
jgi:hypothetical protein